MIVTNNPLCLRVRPTDDIGGPGVTAQSLKGGAVDLTVSIGTAGCVYTVEREDALALAEWLIANAKEER